MVIFKRGRRSYAANSGLWVRIGDKARGLRYALSNWTLGGSLSADTLESKVLAEVTLLLQDWERGEVDALDRLVPAVYRELRAIAGNYFQAEKGQTLCATALVNEVYLRLAEGERIAFRDREHFFCLAGRMMRRILVEHARKRLTRKRGGELRVTLDDHNEPGAFPTMDLPTMITLGDGLDALEKEQPRAAQILELRIFAGLNNSEIAEVTQLSLATVKREWTLAKQRLFLFMRRGGERALPNAISDFEAE